MPSRQILHILTEPSDYIDTVKPDTGWYIRSASGARSPGSESPTSSSRLSETTSGTTVSTEDPDSMLFSALCMHAFESSDPSHLSFHQNEILDIIVQEESGWWAACRRNSSDVVGWIPGSFVQRLSAAMDEKLWQTPEDLRESEYEKYATDDESLRGDLKWDAEQQSPSANQILIPKTALDVIKEAISIHPPPSPLTSAPPAPPSGSPLIDKREPFPSSNPIPINNHRPLSQDISISPRSRRITVDSMARLFKLRDGKDSSKSAPGWNTLVESTSELEIAEEGTETPHAYKRRRSELPWFQRPRYNASTLTHHPKTGVVVSGTLHALVERLIELPSSTEETAQDKAYRDAFLMTFRTFTSPQELFDLLVARYEEDPANNLSNADFRLWRDEYMIPQQFRILEIFKRWSTCCDMLVEEPHIVPKLVTFLSLIPVNGPLASVARQLLQGIRVMDLPPSLGKPNTGRTRKITESKSIAHLISLDPGDLADQLFLHEHRLYEKIRPQECINWGRTQSGQSVINMIAFCATHDRLAAWVQLSVLELPHPNRRAKVVDHWIKVAERCRALNNFSSLSAIVTALSSSVIKRLHLTWAAAARSTHLDDLAKLNDAPGNFSAYREALKDVDSSCVPFMAMFLTEIVRTQCQPDTRGDPPLINFTKRMRFFDTITSMLRFQTKPHFISEKDSILAFVEHQLTINGEKDQDWIWKRSETVQKQEMKDADILGGLEKAGF